MNKVQASGRTYEVAVDNALKEIGLSADEVEITVLQEGGLFRQYKVEVCQKQQEQATEQPQAEQTAPTEPQKSQSAEAARAQDFLQNVLTKMGFDCTVSATTEGDTVLLNIFGKDTPSAIGYRGEVLDALQYLCSLELTGKENKHKRVTLDAEGYRAKREKTLQKLAGNLEQKVKRTGKAVNLEPMNPYERRIIHTALQNSKFVTTESEGQGNTRHVVISPKGQSDILNVPNAPRKTLNFVYRSDKKRKR